jgi:hypothetical protein
MRWSAKRNAMQKTTFITTELLLRRLHDAGWRWQFLRYGDYWMALLNRGDQGGAGRAASSEEALIRALRQAYTRAEHCDLVAELPD